MTLSILVLSFGLMAASIADREHELENQYYSYIDTLNSVTSKKPLMLKQVADKKLFIDALWDQIVGYDNLSFRPYFDQLNGTEFELADQLRIEVLKTWPMPAVLPQRLIDQFILGLSEGRLSRRDKATLMSLTDFIRNSEALMEDFRHFESDLYENYNLRQKTFRDKSKDELKDLFFNTPDQVSLKGARMTHQVQLFMFCRYTRHFKCLMVMKDRNNKPVLLEDGTPWSHPSLGKSRKGLPSWVRDGNTPEGVFTIDGVMPYASRARIFGKFRRLILNFVPSSEDEAWIKEYLPASAHDKSWWKSGVVARDVGRNLLRIHGTGIKRTTERDPNHPLRPTLGCVMQRELTFDGVTYKDQRLLLDQMMVAQGLEPIFENEPKIRGTLFVIEIDKQQKSVTLDEVRKILDI